MRIELEYNKKKFVIENDGLQFIAKECRVPDKGEPYEFVLGYFRDFGNAINKIVKLEIGASEDVVSLNEFVERYETAVAEMKRLTEPEF